MASAPFFSIVVPTRSRPAELKRCLEALASIDYPRDRFEAIVVDDGGDPPAGVSAEGFDRAMAVSVLRQSHAGPAAARNLGAARARGDFLAFTDDDCAPERSWLRSLASRLESAPDALVGGC